MAKALQELAEFVDGEVVGDGTTLIERVAGIAQATDGDITFVSNPKYESRAKDCKASAIIVSPKLRDLGRNLLVCGNPYLAFAKIVGLLMERPQAHPKGVDPMATVSLTASLGDDVSIYPYVHVGDNTVIGDRVTLMPGVCVGPDCRIGNDTLLHPGVVLYHGTTVGERVLLHANVVVGAEGFGFAPDGPHYHKIPQVGVAVIEDDVSIGANTTICRGALGRTIIRRGCKIDSQVVISHNVDVGEDTLMVSQVGVSGTVEIGKHVILAGQVGVAGHLEIGDNAMVGGKSAVTHDLAPNKGYLGVPARPIAEERRISASLPKLPQMREKLRDLEKRLNQLESGDPSAES